MKRPTGHPGSWFATYEGEKLPCVHKHATIGHWPHYVDPNVDDRGNWPAFVTAIEEGQKVILTSSHPPDHDGIRRRKSYNAIWRIENYSLQEGRLEFDFVEKLKEFGPN